jgi:putative ABC transport system ATP-binding protein
MCAAMVAEHVEAPPAARPVQSEPVVRVEGLNHYYGEGAARNQVLFDNRIEIPAGQLVVMTGPSGAGKTTLLTLIGALRSAHEGRIEVLGRDLSRLAGRGLVEVRRDIGFIFQMHNLFDALSAYENVKMAAQLGDWPPAEMRQRGAGILERLGLGHRIDYKPRFLSGGERQRVAIGRALVNRPRLILADEPTSALDPDSARRAWNYLKDLQMEGCALVICTHSMEEAEHLAGDIGIMSAGRALAIGSMVELRRRSGLKTRQEVRELPTLQDIYLAIVGNHHELAETRTA